VPKLFQSKAKKGYSSPTFTSTGKVFQEKTWKTTVGYFWNAKLYWFSLKWKNARFELASKDDIP
jgi:hypothetical protein